MARRIEFLPQSLLDLEEQYQYLVENAPEGVADRLLLGLRETTETLSKFPLIGAVRPLVHPRLRDIRHWPIAGFPNHRSFYMVTEDAVQILHILHSARDVDAILESDD